MSQTMTAQQTASTETGFLRPAPRVKGEGFLDRLELANESYNVASLSFALGGLVCFGLSNAVRPPFALTDQSWPSILLSSQLGVYLGAWATFHMLEYFITAVYNPKQVNVDSFLLNNGRHYHVAHAFALCEFLLTARYYPARLAQAKAAFALPGLLLVLAGQALRSSAMATAAASFTHLIATSKRQEHVLVTWGVYSYFRHPSYVAFFYWALGTQLVLGNPLAFAGFALVMWKYFEARIRAEERYLVSFFGDEYVQYRQQVPTRLPLIH